MNSVYRYDKILANSATNLGYSVKIDDLGNSSYLLEIKDNNGARILFNRATSNLNNSLAARLVARKNILQNQLPDESPKARIWEIGANKDEIIKFIDTIQSFVLKPDRGSRGVDIHFGRGISDFIKLADKLKPQLSNSDTVKVEEFVEGSEFRVLIWKDNIIDIVQRIPASVLGDGKSTIQDLIKKKNNYFIEHKFPRKIEIDQSTINKLKEQNLIISDVPTNNRNVILKYVCNRSQGGEVREVTDISKDTLNKLESLTKNIVSKYEINYAGIDLIAKDINNLEFGNNAWINEINSEPSLMIHYDIGKEVFMEKLLSTIFNDPVAFMFENTKSL